MTILDSEFRVVILSPADWARGALHGKLHEAVSWHEGAAGYSRERVPNYGRLT